MSDAQQEPGLAALTQISNAMVALHKSHFGRGPTKARSYFAGPDALVCVLEDVLLPAELKLTELGDEGRVRDARTALQAATAADFVGAVEEIVHRRVRSFASAIDPHANTVFENFLFDRSPSLSSVDPE